MLGQKHEKQPSKPSEKDHKNASENILRALAMLKKAIGRPVRRRYQARRDSPKLFFQIEAALTRLRAWIQAHRFFVGFPAFQVVLGEQIQSLRQVIASDSVRNEKNVNTFLTSRRTGDV